MAAILKITSAIIHLPILVGLLVHTSKSAGLLALDHRSLHLPMHQCTVVINSLLSITVAGPRWSFTNFPFKKMGLSPHFHRYLYDCRRLLSSLLFNFSAKGNYSTVIFKSSSFFVKICCHFVCSNKKFNFPSFQPSFALKVFSPFLKPLIRLDSPDLMIFFIFAAETLLPRIFFENVKPHLVF
ncbi:hypothetical protein DFR59_102429 [Falsibacillus pallidus]|uniref:Uncharacterized protein n=1 Tax=Falsibacillus pallidus TaxID=493781 RepID=A0A370GPZ6_9BACI|nr:hypothetical protein DFR59_102429 [Falsibacillus pallidus]